MATQKLILRAVSLSLSTVYDTLWNTFFTWLSGHRTHLSCYTGLFHSRLLDLLTLENPRSQSSDLFSIITQFLGVLIQSDCFIDYVLKISKCISPAITSLTPGSYYRTIYLTVLTGISEITCLKWNFDSPLPTPNFCRQYSFQILPHLSKWNFHSSNCLSQNTFEGWLVCFLTLIQSIIKSCYSVLWNTSRIQPLLNTSIAVTLIQSICCLDCHNSFPAVLPASIIAPYTWFFTYQPDLNVSHMLHLCSKPSSDFLSLHFTMLVMPFVVWFQLCVWPIPLLPSVL